jgi:hypothetical protein
MQPPNDVKLLSRDQRVLLAIQALKSDASLSQRHIAALYSVPRSTLSDQHQGMASRRVTHPNQSNLTKSEEDSLVARIRDLSLHRFTPCHAEVRSIADQLLAVRGGSCVGIN